MGKAEILKLARQADHIYASKGKKVVSLDMKKDAPDDDAVLAVMMGPTGNLRAPTVRKGKTLVVGFNEDTYAKLLS